jgi:hypothetical protein
MRGVAESVLAEVGCVDILIGCLRRFPWHPRQIDGSGRFVFCFPEDRLGDAGSWPWGLPITLGVDGFAALVRQLSPRYALPYAHWWHPREASSHRVDGQAEVDLLSEVAKLLGSRRAGTAVCHWNVGDRFSLVGSAPVVQRAVAERRERARRRG